MPDPQFDDIASRASKYIERHHLTVENRLGSGKDGTVWSTRGRPVGPSAIKVFGREEPFRQERAVYRRLAQHDVGGATTVRGHAVPVLVEADSELLVLEMTLVQRPFVLDFASAALDEPPDFPPEVWAERFAHYEEVFEDDWPKVRQIVAAFRGFGVHLLDLTPGNIGFAFERP